MGYLLTISCYIISFSPSFALFLSFIAHDPVRIILFFLGAFFWLVSLLISSLVWIGLTALTQTDIFSVALIVCISVQELARIAYFVLLKKAQHGLNKITRQGSVSVAPGVSDLHNSRHMLAVVAGLGMGVVAALFLTMNAFAEFSGPGTIGLPQALDEGGLDVNRAGKMLPLFYALSAMLLTLFNVTWTIMTWDTCHKFGRDSTAYVPAILSFITHLIVSIISSQNSNGHHFAVLITQFIILLACIIYCHLIMGGSVSSFAKGILTCIQETTTLKQLRQKLHAQRRREQVVQDEPLTERNTVRT